MVQLNKMKSITRRTIRHIIRVNRSYMQEVIASRTGAHAENFPDFEKKTGARKSQRTVVRSDLDRATATGARRLGLGSAGAGTGGGEGGRGLGQRRAAPAGRDRSPAGGARQGPAAAGGGGGGRLGGGGAGRRRRPAREARRRRACAAQAAAMRAGAVGGRRRADVVRPERTRPARRGGRGLGFVCDFVFRVGHI